MNRKQAKELLPIIQAFAEGKDIEYRTKGFNEDWKKVTLIPELSFKSFEYRVKPEPKYRPFANAEECWQEMEKHQPFGFIKFKDTESGYYMLTGISKGVEFGINYSLFSYDRIFDDYTFADGLPFGVKVEE